MNPTIYVAIGAGVLLAVQAVIGVGLALAVWRWYVAAARQITNCF